MFRLLSAALLCALSILPDLVFAQPDTLWTSTVRGTGNTTLYDCVPLSVGGYAVVGVTSSASTSNDFFVARLGEDGGVLWSNSYATTPAAEEAQGVVEINGTIVFAGYGQVDDVPSGRNKVVLMGLSLEGDSLWYQTYISNGQAKARDIVVTPDGNLAAVGYALGINNSTSDVVLLKFSATGELLWDEYYGGDQTDVGQQLVVIGDSLFAILGNTRSEGQGQYDFWLLKTDTAGTLVYDQTFGTTGEEIGYGIAATADGGILLAGRQGTTIAYGVSVPPVGEPWTQTYSGHDVVEQVRGVLLRESSLAFVGFSGPSNGVTRPFMIGTSVDGELLWTWPLGDLGSGNALHSVQPAPSGGGVAVGAYTIAGQQYGYIVRIAPEGGIEGSVTELELGFPVHGVRISAIGQNRYSFTDSEGHYVLELRPGTYDIVASGYCVAPDTVFGVEVIGSDLVTADISVGVPEIENPPSSVNMVAQNHLLSSGFVRLTNEGSGDLHYSLVAIPVYPPSNWLTVVEPVGLVPPGETVDVEVTILADTTDDGVYDYFGRLMLHSNSCPDTVRDIPVLVTVLDAQPLPSSVQEFALHPAYPNPFNSETSLRFDLPRESRVTLALFDVTGRQVRTLTDKDYSAGAYTISIDASALAAGMYFARLQAGNFHAVRKLVYLR